MSITEKLLKRYRKEIIIYSFLVSITTIEAMLFLITILADDSFYFALSILVSIPVPLISSIYYASNLIEEIIKYSTLELEKEKE